MKILALEFSSLQRSVGLVCQGDSPGTTIQYEAIETGPRPNKPFEMMEAVLRQAGIEREQVDRLAVGLGPGSYTGIRAAIGLAQGWQLGRGTTLLGLSSVECIVAGAQAAGVSGLVAVVIDAQRGEFYLANYDLTSTQWREVQALRLASRPAVTEAEKEGYLVIGPEVLKWFTNGRTIFPCAAILGKLGINESKVVPGEQLEPIYLRATTFVKAPPARILPD